MPHHNNIDNIDNIDSMGSMHSMNRNSLTPVATSVLTTSERQQDDNAKYNDDKEGESSKKSKRLRYTLVWFHFLMGIALHDVFVSALARWGLGFFGVQWIVFCVVQALLPASLACLLCRSELISNVPMKLFVRIFYSTMAITSIVYIWVGSMFIYDDRSTEMVAMSSIGLFSSLYFWLLVERCFDKDSETGTASGPKNPMDDSDSTDETKPSKKDTLV